MKVTSLEISTSTSAPEMAASDAREEPQCADVIQTSSASMSDSSSRGMDRGALRSCSQS
jgi:hypothetical protein